MEELLIVVVIILVIVCAVIFGLLRGRIFPSRSAPVQVKRAMTGGSVKIGGDFADLDSIILELDNLTPVGGTADDIISNANILSDNLPKAADVIYKTVLDSSLDLDSRLNAIKKAQKICVQYTNNYKPYLAEINAAPITDIAKNLKTNIRSSINVIEMLSKNDAADVLIKAKNAIDSTIDYLAAPTRAKKDVENHLIISFDTTALLALLNGVIGDLTPIETLKINPLVDITRYKRNTYQINDFYTNTINDFKNISKTSNTQMKFLVTIITTTVKNTIRKDIFEPAVLEYNNINAGYILAPDKAQAVRDMTDLMRNKLPAIKTAIATRETECVKNIKLLSRIILFPFNADVKTNFLGEIISYYEKDLDVLKNLEMETDDLISKTNISINYYTDIGAFKTPLGPYVVGKGALVKIPDSSVALPAAKNDDKNIIRQYLNIFDGFPIIIQSMCDNPSVSTYYSAGKFIDYCKSNVGEITKFMADDVTTDLTPVEHTRLRVIINYLRAALPAGVMIPSIKMAHDLFQAAPGDLRDYYTANFTNDRNTVDAASAAVVAFNTTYTAEQAAITADVNAVPTSIYKISTEIDKLIKSSAQNTLANLNPIYNDRMTKVIKFINDHNTPQADPLAIEDVIRLTDGTIINPIGHIVAFDHDAGYVIINAEIAVFGADCDRLLSDANTISTTAAADMAGAIAYIDTKIAAFTAVPRPPHYDLALKVDINTCASLGVVNPPASGTDLDWFIEYCRVFEDLPSLIVIANVAQDAYAYERVGEYIKYIQDNSAAPSTLHKYLTEPIPEGATTDQMKFYRVLKNFITAAFSTYMKDMSLEYADKKISQNSMELVNTRSIKTIPAVADIRALVALNGADPLKFAPIITDYDNFERDGDAAFVVADAQVFIHDLSSKLNDLETIITNFKILAHKTTLTDLTAKYTVFLRILGDLDTMVARIPAPGLVAENPIEFVLGANKYKWIELGVMPVFDDAAAKRELHAEITAMQDIVNNIFIPERNRVDGEYDAKLTAQETHVTTLRAKISALARNIMSALKAEFAESSERMEAVKQDLEEQDRRDRARKKKEAEERQKLADDEYNARLDALAQIPDETLADRVARIPAEYSNVIHYAMAKRAAKLTKDTSYDVSAAEIGNTAVVRDKLVRFFTAQGIKDVTRDNINSKYAEWQKKNTARLVHQSDIDNPSGVVLELS